MLHLERVINVDVKTIDAIVALGHEFNLALGEVKFDEWAAAQLIDLASEEDSNYFLIILKDDWREVGLLGGVINTPPFSFTKIATELIWYVQPAYRGSIKAIKMVKEFETWARQQGADYVAMVAQENSGSDPSRVYERLGFKLAERTFTKRL